MKEENAASGRVIPSCEYNDQLVVGGFTPTIHDLFCLNSPHGLSLMGSYSYGSFRGENGGVYIYQRIIGSQSLPIVFLWYKPPGGKTVIHPDSYACFRGMCTNELRDDKVSIRSLRGFREKGFRYTINTEEFRCVEEGTIDLSGRRFGLGMNVYCPHRLNSWYYSSVCFETEGTIEGQRVSGIMMWDQAYGPAGENWERMRYFREIEVAWAAGFNLYEDGEKEVVHVANGKGDWGWLFATSGDKVTAIGRSTRARAEVDEEQYAKRVLFETDCGNWEWTAEKDCHLVNPVAPNLPIKWGEGQTRRVGDGRRIVKSLGFLDFFPERCGRM